MASHRHEIPTHLNVEDKAFYGFSVRQVMYLTVGFAGSYGLWNQWPDLALAVRIGIAAVCFSIAVALALIRPAGRGLEEWAFVALHYLALPKAGVWRVGEPDPAVWRPSASRWAELAPRVSWIPATNRHPRKEGR